MRWHFVTICCEKRRKVFAVANHANWMVDMIRSESTMRRFAIHAYCLMPDHLHLLLMGLDRKSDLLHLVKQLKQKSGFEFRKNSSYNLWQKKFYDHVLRSRDSIDAVASYIRMNPLRKRLCRNPKDYPYSGSFALLWESARLTDVDRMPPWKFDARLKAAAT